MKIFLNFVSELLYSSRHSGSGTSIFRKRHTALKNRHPNEDFKPLQAFLSQNQNCAGGGVGFFVKEYPIYISGRFDPVKSGSCKKA